MVRHVILVADRSLKPFFLAIFNKGYDDYCGRGSCRAHRAHLCFVKAARVP
jgi:hypothetical protein